MFSIGQPFFFILVGDVIQAVDDKIDVAEANDVMARTGHSPGFRRVPLRNVPLVLPISRRAQPALVMRISACRRLTEESSRTISRVASRPAQDGIGFPEFSFHVAVDATQADAPFQRRTYLHWMFSSAALRVGMPTGSASEKCHIEDCLALLRKSRIVLSSLVLIRGDPYIDTIARNLIRCTIEKMKNLDDFAPGRIDGYFSFLWDWNLLYYLCFAGIRKSCKILPK